MLLQFDPLIILSSVCILAANRQYDRLAIVRLRTRRATIRQIVRGATRRLLVELSRMVSGHPAQSRVSPTG